MLETNETKTNVEVHDPEILANAKAILDACSSPKDMQEAVLAAIASNEEWRGSNVSICWLQRLLPVQLSDHSLHLRSVFVLLKGILARSIAGLLVLSTLTRLKPCASNY